MSNIFMVFNYLVFFLIDFAETKDTKIISRPI